MKKILCGILGASACVAVASVEQVVSTIEVRAVSSTLTNVVVAVPGLDLASDSALAISNLVKTTNLSNGDRLVAFCGNAYESWTLADGVWTKNAKLINIGGDGSISDGEGTASDLMTLGVGSGIWLSRVVSGTSKPFYVYARQPAETNSTVSAGTSVLLGNPTVADATPAITDAQNGDQIIVPSSDGFLGVKTFFFGKKTADSAATWLDDDLKEGLPSSLIKAGTGFWYKAASGGSTRTISWQ